MKGSERGFYFAAASMLAFILELIAEFITGTNIEDGFFYLLAFVFAIFPSLMIDFIVGVYLFGKYLLAIPFAAYLILWIYGPKWLKPRVKDAVYLFKSRVLRL